MVVPTSPGRGLFFTSCHLPSHLKVVWEFALRGRHKNCKTLLLYLQANFLQSRLLGILAFYNTVLLTNSDLEEKRLALESLTKLMQVMGRKFITTVRVKVMGILRLCLRFQDKGFPELSCDAWESFVRNVELSSLGPMLSQIVVTLLPYLNKLPARVTQIFHFLIVENKSSLQDYFHEIYFLPDIPELRRVSAVLRSCSGKASKKMDLQAQLRQSLKGISHESADVQRHALSKLKQLLHDNQVNTTCISHKLHVKVAMPSHF